MLVRFLLTYTATQLQFVIQEMNSYKGKDINMADLVIRHAYETLQSLDVAVRAVKSGPTFDLTNTLSVISPLTSLNYEVHQLSNTLKSKKDMLDKERISPVVYMMLKQTYNSGTDLVKAIVEKLPIGVSAIVNVLSQEIVSTLGTTRDLYKTGSDVNVIVNDPNHPISGGYQVQPANVPYNPQPFQQQGGFFQPPQQGGYQPQQQGPYSSLPPQSGQPQPPPWQRQNPTQQNQNSSPPRQYSSIDNNSNNNNSPQTPPPGYSWFKGNLNWVDCLIAWLLIGYIEAHFYGPFDWMTV